VFSGKRDFAPVTRVVSSLPRTRPAVSGKALYCNGTRLWVKGVTYGTFRPDVSGNEFHDIKLVENDLKAISARGFNCIRTLHSSAVVAAGSCLPVTACGSWWDSPGSSTLRFWIRKNGSA
jgi:hypothetical protein